MFEEYAQDEVLYLNDLDEQLDEDIIWKYRAGVFKARIAHDYGISIYKLNKIIEDNLSSS